MVKIKLKTPPTISCGSFPTTYDFADTNGTKYYFYYRYGTWEFCYDNNDRTEIAAGSFGNKSSGECTWHDAKQAMLSKGYDVSYE